VNTAPPPIYKFGDFRIDVPKRRLLRADGDQVPLTPRVFETLLYLVEHSGEVIERDRIMDAVWPDAVVEENNITQNISTLRRILGEAPGSHQFIVTVPGRGYRFVAAVTTVEEAAEASSAGTTRLADEAITSGGGNALAPTPMAGEVRRRRNRLGLGIAAGVVAALLVAVFVWSGRRHASGGSAVSNSVPLTISEKSVAVLPFANLSGDPENAYFADGIKDEILARLSKVAALKVISRTSTETYKNAPDNLREIALRLGVAHFLEGSVQKSGDTVRVTVQLIHAETDTHLWAETYDRKLTDMFQVETEVAQRIATALQATLTGAETRAVSARPTTNVEAHEAYLKGRYFWNKRTLDGFKQAADYFNRAVELDPAFAPAWVGLADALLFLSGERDSKHGEPETRGNAALRKALELDESLGEAHASMGLRAMNFEWDWARAEQQFKRAIELNPNYATAHQWYGEFLADMGRPDEAIAEIKRARELDPLSVIINSDVGKVYLLTRHYDEAVDQFKRTLELDPNFAQTHGLLGLTYSLQGLHDKALNEVCQIRNLDNDPMILAWLGYIHGASGNLPEQEKALNRLRELATQTHISPLWMAVAASSGDNDATFEWLEKVFQERSVGGALVLKANPTFDRLRADPRFPGFLRRANLVP
jgi:TolB-like protein/DNA-binding winged helix-turn-helix (wHTH) protein/Tfp pilus assembly protein PilF